MFPGWIKNPFSRIQQIFDECLQSGDDWREKISNILLEDVSKPEILSKLPWLNESPLHKLYPNQVVRYRGMIQDMFEQEFYMDTYEVKKADGTTYLKPGRYLDVAHCGKDEEIHLESSKCETGDRASFYCISIPGENEWVKKMYLEDNPDVQEERSSTGQSKRSLDDDENEIRFVPQEGCSDDCDKGSVNYGNRSAEGKRRKGGNEKRMSLNHRDISYDLNFPFPDMKGMACMLKVYSESDLKINDMVEVIGILSLDPFISSDANDSENGDERSSVTEDKEVDAPPPSLVPRLHTISVVKKAHNNPLLPLQLNVCDFPQHPQPSSMRELLGSVLDVALLGDELAAEYLLCHLVSSVYMRQGIIPLGKFSLNILGITEELRNQDYPKLLYGLLQMLTTHSYYLPMSLENMNKLTFIPKKDYDRNRLKSGILQLPPHTHLVIDETHLTAGQLDTNGLKNLTALGNLVNWQKVDYDFQFHPLEQHSNVPVLILSEAKAMITSDSKVRLDPKHTNVALAFSKVSSMLNDNKVRDDLRSHLTYSKLVPYSLSECMQEKIQNDFVESRKHENGMTTDDLHTLLTLAKLLAQGCGKVELTDLIWRSAKMLETERKGKLRST